MSTAATFDLIEQERLRLADLADGWSPSQWDEPNADPEPVAATDP